MSDDWVRAEFAASIAEQEAEVAALAKSLRIAQARLAATKQDQAEAEAYIIAFERYAVDPVYRAQLDASIAG